MLNAVPKQFRLNDDGQILYQADPTNPMPGVAVAIVTKGATALQPDIQVLDTNLIEGQDRAAISSKLKEWLKAHIATVLEPLVALETPEENMAVPVRGIASQVYEAMGIVPRAKLEELITGLDVEMRRVLRQKQIKLGPILVFIPALNKPAAVHLRALLWSLWNGKALPAKIPSDGMVSKSLAAEGDVNLEFYSAIGYPVYANRAIRVDMLDRLISAIYDNAKDGGFKATHAMAEWLGCSIPDLYAVIEAMGHKKINDPAEQKVEAAVPVETPAAETAVAEVPAADIVVVAPVPALKPELATFRLRRGKAYGEGVERKPREEKSGEKRTFRSADKKPGERQEFRKPKRDDDRKGGKPKFKDRDRDRGGKDHVKERDNREPRVVASASATSAESPFSILQQLKTKQGGQ